MTLPRALPVGQPTLRPSAPTAGPAPRAERRACPARTRAYLSRTPAASRPAPSPPPPRGEGRVRGVLSPRPSAAALHRRRGREESIRLPSPGPRPPVGREDLALLHRHER